MLPISNEKKRRLAILACLLFGCFALLIAFFYKTQIIEGEKWSEMASKQHYFFVSEPFRRGTFLSNTSVQPGHPEKYQPFVVDIEKFHLYVDPLSIPKEKREEVRTALFGLLDLSEEKRNSFEEQFKKNSRSRKLAMWLSRESRDTIIAWWQPYAKKNKLPRNALYFLNDFQRSYPFEKLLGQVLHTVQNNRNEVTKQVEPKGGLELYFNTYLQGREGKRKMMRSPRNAMATGEVISPPEHGADIYLTINHSLQAIVEDELAKGIEEAKAKGGWALMMEPRTGEILALAQYPFFYPPDYPTFFSDANLVENTKVKAITDANEPGSVVKPMTMAIAMKANEELKKRRLPPLFDPAEKIPTANGFFPGRSKELKDGRVHKYLNMDMALQKSANIYPARLVQGIVETLGDDWYRTQLIDIFGVSRKTGIEIPSETNGILPVPGKVHPNGKLEWSKATPYSLAIGYNLQMSSIQVVRALAVFANGGYFVDPTIIKKIVRTKDDGSQEVLVDNMLKRAKSPFPRVLSPMIVEEVVKGMRYVTTPRGSSPSGNVSGYTEVGKSGTAEKLVGGSYSKKEHLSSFVGFAPVSNAAFVLLIAVDEPEYGFLPNGAKKHLGGTCAGPVFRKIAERSLKFLGVKPDDPYGYPPGDPRYNRAKTVWNEETQKLQQLYDQWNG